MVLSGEGAAIVQAITKLLRAIEGEAERLAKKRDMPHLATGANGAFAIEMQYCAGNIQ